MRGVYYGWWLVGVAALVMALGTVPLFQGMTVWFPVLETRFAWSRAQLSWAFSLTRVEGSITGPIGGYLIERLGPRRMVLIGMPILGGGFVIFSRVEELWHLYVAFVVMSVGAGLGTWLPVMTVLNNWFLKRRTTAMALAMEGYAIGGIALIPLLSWGIDPEQFGPDRWRSAAMGIGIVIILLALPISLLVRNRPEDYGQRPDGNTSDPGPPATTAQAGAAQPSMVEPGLTWQEAMRTREFWMITMGHACSSVVVVTMMVHLGSMLNIDRGLPLPTVGWIVATYTAVGAVSILVGGYLGERIPMRLALSGFSAIQTLGLAVILMSESTSMAFLFAVLLGIGFGGRTPLTTAIRGVYFGRRAYASITGMSMIPMNIMMFAMPIFGGYMYDIKESYDIPLGVLVIVSFLGACAFLVLGRPKPLPPVPAPPGGSKA